MMGFAQTRRSVSLSPFRAEEVTKKVSRANADAPLNQQLWCEMLVHNLNIRSTIHRDALESKKPVKPHIQAVCMRSDGELERGQITR